MSKTIAIITGASSGIGREMALLIDRSFPHIKEIWLVARRVERLEALSKRMRTPVRILELDLLIRSDIFELERQLYTSSVRVGILVNAAGFGKIGNVGENTAAEEMDMVRLNCEALIGVTHVVLPFVREKGRIIQFASLAAFSPQPRFAVYAATKAMVHSYSKALGSELRSRNIVVTSVCPGPVKTEFFEVAQTEQEVARYKKWFMADPKKVAKKALIDSCKGRSQSIYGLCMKVCQVALCMLPTDLMLAILRKTT